MRPIAINRSERSYARHAYVLWFGACGPTRVLVYARSLEDAIEIAAEWLVDHAPGHIMQHDDPELDVLRKEAADELFDRDVDLRGEDLTSDEWGEIEEQAFADLTYTESGYLTSYEWGIVCEDPSPADLADLYGVTCGSCGAGSAMHRADCDRLVARAVAS